MKCVTICFQFYQHDSSLIKDSFFAFTSFLGIIVGNESKSTVKNEALILLHALSSNEVSKHDTCDTDKHTSRVNFPSSANVYACKSCIYFFLLSKIYYKCLTFQQYKLQFSQKISCNDKECHQFHISDVKDVDFTSHLTCKVTAYFTRVHVVHKCKETWQTRMSTGKKYPNFISKNTDLSGGKHSPDVNTPLKTRQFL